MRYFTRSGGVSETREREADLSDGSYKGSPKEDLVVQVDYSCRELSGEPYKPGDLEIRLDNLFYGCGEAQVDVEIKAAANYGGQSGYKWDLEVPEGEALGDLEEFVFTNAEEVSSAIEGSFQVEYIAQFLGDHAETNSYGMQVCYPEEFEDSCEESFSGTSSCMLNGGLPTSPLSVSLSRTYMHPWKRQQFTLEGKAEACFVPPSAADTGTGDRNDYVWVAYKYRVPEPDQTNPVVPALSRTSYPYYRNKAYHVKASFPSDCIVLDGRFVPAGTVSGGKRHVDYTGIKWNSSGDLVDMPVYYVGYPKAAYGGGGDFVVSQDAVLAVEHDHVGLVDNANASLSVNLGEFSMEYGGGGNIATALGYVGGHGPMYYEAMSGHSTEKGTSGIRTAYVYMPATSTLPGVVTDVHIGIDAVFAPGEDGHYRMLSGGDYYFQEASFPGLLDAKGKPIPDGQFDVSLYVRREGEDAYSLLEEFPSAPGTHPLDGDGEGSRVEAYYFLIHGVDTGLLNTRDGRDEGDYSTVFTARINLDNAKIAKSGDLYVFNYLKVYDGDVLLDKGDPGNYGTMAKDLLMPYDEKWHGEYLYRGYDHIAYTAVEDIKSNASLEVKKGMALTSQDDASRQYLGKADIRLTKGLYHDSYFLSLISQGDQVAALVPDSQRVHGFEVYDLLPAGMRLAQTEDEVRGTVMGPNSWYYHIFKNQEHVYDITQECRDAFSMEVVENWQGTGRTWVRFSFDFGEDAYIIHPVTWLDMDYITFSYGFSISYQAALEESTYVNNARAGWVGTHFGLGGAATDDGGGSQAEADIDRDGDTAEEFAFATSSLVVDGVSASHQELSKWVQTDLAGYSQGTAEASPSSQYSYKLAFQAGVAAAKGLVIYDTLEVAHGGQPHWQGTFAGVDTSWLEGKGYRAEVYVSPEASPGLLGSGAWQPYAGQGTLTFAPKAVAFRLLDVSGAPALVPAGSMVYAEVLMAAPPAGLPGYAYNQCSVSWEAPDGAVRSLVSNVVRVHLHTEGEPGAVLPDTGGPGAGVPRVLGCMSLAACACACLGRRRPKARKML